MNSARITVIGDIGIDLVMGPIERWPEIGTETIMERSEMRAGGSGGNTVLALRSLGAKCRLIAQHGDDPLGSWLAAQFIDIDAALEPIDGSATSLSVGVIHGCGERTFMTTRGHLEHCEWPAMRGRLTVPAAEGAIALLTGAFLLPRLRGQYEEIIEHLHGAGYRVAIDTGWPSGGWTVGLREQTLRWLRRCDHVLLNELEITALADVTDLSQAMRKIGDQLPDGATLVAKCGPAGARALQGGTFHQHGAPSAAVFDTIGAGDAFNAGYLHAWRRDAPLASVLRAGCISATAIIARFPRSQIKPGELCDA